MIVRDDEENLPKCLSSVAGLFDEVVEVDTWSKDRTREIALESGARVFDFVWVDDFAAARNGVDQGIYGHLTLRNLAVLAAERGDHVEATRLWHPILVEFPQDPEALARLERPATLDGCPMGPRG